VTLECLESNFRAQATLPIGLLKGHGFRASAPRKRALSGYENMVCVCKNEIAGHSARRAITGSILVARSAGKNDAHSATSSNTTDSTK
jgi:hypothetical protein